MTEESSSRPATLLAQAGHYEDAATGGVTPPIQPSVTFARDRDYALRLDGVSYARDRSPTFLPAEHVLARLEGGAQALLFASGMAAATAVFRCLAPGDHVVAPRVMYWALRDWLQRFCAQWGLELDLYATGDDADLARRVRPGRTRLVWVETPCNPTWEVTDIAAAAAVAHAAGARLAVDSTVATPLLTRPLELGADLVFHSATKYLNGHSDVVAGALVTRDADAHWRAIADQRANGGAILGPFEAWLLLRGMRTLDVRLRRACDNAMTVARHFAAHPEVEAVLYPGLQEHPGHAVAARQMSGGFGGMLSLLVRGDAARARAVAGKMQVFVRATSLGGVESLVEHRASIEGPGSPVPPNLLRMSIGIEDPADLVADIEQALG
ncbi:MAG: PLP-dependent transferase [Ectothiorhodospiraceae bacterium]|nr:PLP-dependent transferase [Ectothiorhodospiraceae bacterium]